MNNPWCRLEAEADMLTRQQGSHLSLMCGEHAVVRKEGKVP